MPKTKDGAYIINLEEYKSIGTHKHTIINLHKYKAIRIQYGNGDVTYVDSFGVKYIPSKIKKFIGNENITTNIYEILAEDSIMCGYFCIGFIGYAKR